MNPAARNRAAAAETSAVNNSDIDFLRPRKNKTFRILNKISFF